MMPQAALEAKINRLAYGEIEAPEDVDTLRNDDDDGTDDFKHFVESPAELRGPDLDQTKRLDRQQQQQGLDRDRRVEYVEDVEGAPMARQGAAEYDDDYGPAHSMDYTPKGVDPRYKRQPIPKRGPGDEGPGGYFRTKENIMSRRYYAAEDDGPPPPDGGPDSGKSDEELIEEAEADLQAAEDAGAGEPGSDAGGTDDDYSDSDDDEGPPPPDDSGDEGDSDLPPWLQDGGEQDSGPPPPPPSERESRRRQGNRRSSGQKRRRTRNGVPMSLAQRSRVAAAQRPRNHFADNSGHFDGGPYGEDNQGEQEEVFLSDTPSAEAVAAPTPGDSTISNTPNNLVAALQQRILSRNAQQKRDIIAYEQITGKRITADDNTADAMDSPAQSVSGTEVPTQADPKVNTGPGGEQVTGDDFTSVALPNVETQPNNDRSAAVYAAFDRWLQQSTGRTARQHGNPSFIRRCAARFCQSNRIPVEAMFPALGFVLREARNNEGTRRAGMRKRADESLDVAAPQDRIDVEAPVKNTTDADAQASQFDLGDFGNNAGDNLADPDLSPDSQIWAPGEGDSAANKTSNRKADGLTAVRYAEAYIRAGLAPNTSEEKWKIAGLAQTMRYATIRDRIALLDAVNQQRAASARRTAGVHRGANGSVPPGFGQRQLTAGTAREAANDIATDSAIFIK